MLLFDKQKLATDGSVTAAPAVNGTMESGCSAKHDKAQPRSRQSHTEGKEEHTTTQRARPFNVFVLDDHKLTPELDKKSQAVRHPDRSVQLNEKTVKWEMGAHF